ncbi:LLM class flavin-dependent oxidoreductase [Dietzia aerolata]|uniref:LLM class flavin-dependent oxidoreductase n=1 Tax=Dietzia aerolata TaxID=595984 RepID=UPI00362A4C74
MSTREHAAPSPAAPSPAGREHLGRVGLWTGALEGVAPAQLPDVLGELDQQGWGSLWFGEAVGREAFTAAQMYLGATSRMAIGTGIANIYGRDASAAGSAARTLEAQYPGRFVLGLGVSHAPLVERHRGHNYGRPLSAMREYLDALDGTRPSPPGRRRCRRSCSPRSAPRCWNCRATAPPAPTRTSRFRSTPRRRARSSAGQGKTGRPWSWNTPRWLPPVLTTTTRCGAHGPTTI